MLFVSHTKLLAQLQAARATDSFERKRTRGRESNESTGINGSLEGTYEDLTGKLGFDHKRLSYRYQGLDGRLTGVEPARVVKELLA